MGIPYKLDNQRFGNLIVLYRAPNQKTRQSWWKCRCDCGKEFETKGVYLVTNEVISCGCIEKPKKQAHNFCGCGDLSGKYWSRLKRHAKNRNLPFELKIEEAWEIFVKQDGKCALSGLEIKLSRNFEKDEKQTASLDRIDSKVGYFKKNVQWVHLDVNKIKNNLPEDRLFFICERITSLRTGVGHRR